MKERYEFQKQMFYDGRKQSMNSHVTWPMSVWSLRKIWFELTVNYDGFVVKILEMVELTALVWIEYVRTSSSKSESIIISISGRKLLISCWSYIFIFVKKGYFRWNYKISKWAEIQYLLSNDLEKRSKWTVYGQLFKILSRKTGRTPFKVARFERFAVGFKLK